MNRLLNRENRIEQKDKGSTLITVIVAIAFVTILTSIILGTTLVNVRMKGIDKRTRDDFYYAEKALNDVYTGLGQRFAQIAGDEYNKAFKKVGFVDEASGEDYNLAETAEKDFRENFVKETYDLVHGITPAQLQKYITSSRGTVDSVGDVVYQKKNGDSASSEADADRVVIKNVQISDTDVSGYRAVITTDIVINTPTVDFLGTNADVSDYGLIANEGLYILGDGTDSTKTTINGNVYAGVHETERTADTGFKDDDFKERTDRFARPNLFGGINIKSAHVEFSGNYIVSKGDINLAGTAPQLRVYTPTSLVGSTNLANLWYTTLRTVSDASLPDVPKPVTLPLTNPTIDIDANVFALNDLSLNADNSCVRINGNYYGYNDKTIPAGNVLGLKTDLLDPTKKREDAESSAIIINGSDTYLSMEDVKNFVLMGKAYIDFTSDTDTNAGAISVDKQVVPTAESVALKTNQQLYLVPPDFLDGPNPTTEGSGVFNVSIAQSDLESWFGYPCLDPPVSNPTDIGTSYTVTFTDGTKVYYDYLKFNDKAWIREADNTFTASAEPLGTGGSVSSKTRFFYEIMTSRKAYEDAYASNPEGKSSLNDYIAYKESTKVQPSAYRLWERISLSMGYNYFDLRECVIGDGSSDAHYYARNAVINYKRDGSGLKSTVLDNTDGMYRYASYPQNLFYRYAFLCTKLDGKENELLDHDWATDTNVNLTKLMNDWKITYSDSNVAAPMCHFVDIDQIGSMCSITDAETAGLKRGAYGVVVATDSDLVIDSGFAGLTGTTFKGVALVDGDITVGSGINVDGLLMATGSIILKGSNNVNYNKGLVQARIEKEMNLVKNWKSSPLDTVPYKDYYLITYLADDSSGTPTRIYDVVPGSKIRQDRIEADYNDFMHYENWQKGQK